MTAQPDWLRPVPLTDDQLATIRQHVATARDLQQRKAELDEDLKATNKTIRELLYQTLPDVMDSAGVSALTLPAQGNQPAVAVTCGPFYRANIAAEWPEQKRKEALAWLDQNGHGDLIKTDVTVQFARQERQQAQALAAKLESMGHSPTVQEAVPWNTLTAWLKQMVEEGNTPPLDTIGGTVGRVATLKREA